MLNVNDLRLGNWVLESKNTQYPMWVSAMGGDENSNWLYLDFEGNEGDVWEADAKTVCGVPLSEEILEANGFRQVGHRKYHLLCDNGATIDLKVVFQVWQVAINHSRGLCYTGVLKDIIHVHELQNAYRLITGSELDIKL